MEEGELVIYQYSRYFGIGWKAPAGSLDHPEWTDVQGRPVRLAKPPTEDPTGWEVVLSASTDPEGWQYATVFQHLEHKRAGGRASQRLTDVVRRRLWRRADHPSRIGRSPKRTSGRLAPSGTARPEPLVAASDERIRRAHDSDARKSALLILLRLGREMLRRRRVWDLVPWDIAAPYLLTQRHIARYSRSRAAAASRSLAARAEASRRAREADEGCAREGAAGPCGQSAAPGPGDSDPEARGGGPSPLRIHATFRQQVIGTHAQEGGDGAEGGASTPLAAPATPQRTLLQDLLVAATHARAAYGYAVTAGMMESVPSFVRMATVQPLSFDVVGGASAEANADAVAGLTGIDPADILMCQWHASTYRPAHYLAADRAARCLVLAVRGSAQIGDLISDLAADPMEVHLAGSSGWVHRGIFSAATFLHCSTADALAEAAQAFPGWPLLITGHSLGGGASALLAMLLRETGVPEGLGPVHAITIGSAAVASAPLAAAATPYATSLVLGADIIPHLSVASVQRLLLEMSSVSPTRRAVEGVGKRITQALSFGGTAGRDQVATAQPDTPPAEAPAKAAAGAPWASLRRVEAEAASRMRRPLMPLVPVVEPGGASPPGSARVSVAPVAAATMAAPTPGRRPGLGGDSDRLIPVIDLSLGPEAGEDAPGGDASRGRNGDGPTRAGSLAPAEPIEPGDIPPPAHELHPGLRGGSSHPPTPSRASAEPWEADGDQPHPTAVPGDPEHLTPAGRLLWIFTADEQVIEAARMAAVADGVVGNNGRATTPERAAAAVAAGVPASPAELREAVDVSGADADAGAQRRSEAREARDGGEGEAAPGIPGDQAGSPSTDAAHPPSPPAPPPPPADAPADIDPGEEGSPRPPARGLGEVGAWAKSQFGQFGALFGGGGAEPARPSPPASEGSGEAPGTPTRVAGAERATLLCEVTKEHFQGILWVPDCINDHLPDRYLQALQQL